MANEDSDSYAAQACRNADELKNATERFKRRENIATQMLAAIVISDTNKNYMSNPGHAASTALQLSDALMWYLDSKGKPCA